MNEPSVNLKTKSDDTRTRDLSKANDTWKACPRCGGQIAAKAAEGLCQKCLLLAALDVDVTINPDSGDETAETGGLGRFGDFKLLDEVARGGMGIVYRAHQVSLNRIVAIKMILSNHLASENDVRRFYAEATAAARLEHPGIVPIFEVGEIEEQHYYVMPFVAGPSFAQLIADESLTIRERVEMLASIAEAVHFAHTKGIVHRDLKPANILVDNGSDPRITDFGLAKMLHEGAEHTNPGQLMGTPSFMSPEQASGEVATEPSDIYSLGALMYAAFCERPPFVGDSPLDVVMQVKNKEPVAPSILTPRLPRDLETICLKCLEKNPAKRYSSAADVASELRRFLAGEPINARPIRTSERLIRWGRRNPTTALLLASVVAVTLVGLAFSIGLWQRAERNLEMATLNYNNSTYLLIRARSAEKSMRRERNLTQKSLQIAEENLYLTRVSLAQQKWKDNHVNQALRQLELCPPELRDWEWHYLQRACSLETGVILPDDGAITALCVDSAQSMVAGGFRNGMVRVWSLDDYKLIHEIPAHKHPVADVCFNEEGNALASTSTDRTTKVWNVEDATIRFEPIAHGNYGKGLVCIPNTNLFACLDYRGQMQFIDWDTGDVDRETNVGNSSNGIDVDKEGRILVTHSGDTVKIYRLSQQSLETPVAQFSVNDIVTDVAIDPTGEFIAATGGYIDPETIVYDWKNETERFRLRGHQLQCQDVDYSRDGKWILTTSRDKSARIWDAETGDLLHHIRGHGNQVSRISDMPDREQVVTSSDDGTIKIWDIHQLSAGTLRPLGDSARAFARSPSKGLVAVARWTGTMSIYDTDTLELKTEFKNDVLAQSELFFSQDETKLYVVAPRTGILVHDTDDWDKPPVIIGDSVPLQCAAPTNDGDAVVIGCRDGQVWRVSLADPAEMTSLYTHGGQVWTIETSQDGRYTASIDIDGQFMMFDHKENLLVKAFQAHDGVGWDIKFHPYENQVVTCGFDGRIAFWDIETGAAVREFQGHSFGVTTLEFHPTRQRLVSGGTDFAVIMWDLESGIELLNFDGHKKAVYDISISSDGRFIDSIGGDGYWIRHEGAELPVKRPLDRHDLPDGESDAPDAALTESN